MDDKINATAKVVLTRQCFFSESNPQGTSLPPWVPIIRRSNRQLAVTSIDVIKDSLLRIDGNDAFLPLAVQSFEGKGRGVVATRMIPKESFVCEYAGDLVSKNEGVERMMTDPHHTYYSFVSETKFYLSKKRLQCHTLIPWQSSQETSEAIPIRKDFPYFDILNMETKKIKQSGLISLLISRYKGIQTQCDEGKHHVEIGYEKVMLLFFILFGAACSALILLIVIEVPFFNISSYFKNSKSL